MATQKPRTQPRNCARVSGVFGETVCAGIDYITATCAANPGYDLLSEFVAVLLREQLERGERLSHWFGLGYEGHTAGSVQAASNGPTLLVRLSGATAYEHWPTVAKYATNVSRLDVQSTVRLKRPPLTFAEMCESQALRFEEEHKQGRQVELRRNSKLGKTLYVGSPKSDRRIRVYDKGAESKLDQYRDCWRAEVQFNNKLAWAMLNRLKDWQCPSTFAQRVVVDSLARSGIQWKAILARAESLRMPAQRKSTLERKMIWLQSQVRPTVKVLLEHYTEDDIIEALGLDSRFSKERDGP
jgi:hypothetical protein